MNVLRILTNVLKLATTMKGVTPARAALEKLLRLTSVLATVTIQSNTYTMSSVVSSSCIHAGNSAHSKN